MNSLHIQNSRQRRDIMRMLEDNYGFSGKLDGILLRNTQDKVYLISESLDLIRGDNEKELRIDRIGLYIATIVEGDIRLSVEGCQLIGPHATKNVLEIGDEDIEKYLCGETLELTAEDLEKLGEEKRFIILKYKDDFIGAGLVKEGRVHNYLSKIRRIKNLNRGLDAKEISEDDL